MEFNDKVQRVIIFYGSPTEVCQSGFDFEVWLETPSDLELWLLGTISS